MVRLRVAAIRFPLACALAMMLTATFAAAQSPPAGNPHAGMTMPAPKTGPPTMAIAVLSPASGSTCHGIIRFAQEGAAVRVVADIEGLTPGQQHAIHVHEYGDCSSPDASSAGSHYNPEGHAHALPATAERHAGDLGNLTAGPDGKAHYEITITNASIAGPLNPILGRAVIVHAKLDDGGQPVGNAGPRIACGTIGVMKAPEAKK